MHKILEEHLESVCENTGCRKKRNGEKLTSHFSGSIHYASWNCSGCDNENWWKTAFMTSDMDHINQK